MRILFIEDDSKIASFVKKGLKEAGYAVEHTSNGEEGLILALSSDYDAAVVDITLPGIDGLSIIKELRLQKKILPILILSARSSVDDRIKGLETGSDDYLTKPFAFSELLARLQALIRRSNLITEPTSLNFKNLTMDLLNHTVHRDKKLIELQPREYSLLEYLMRNAERVVSKTMIMEQVWNYNFDPETNIVEARICKLREKVDKDFSETLIHTIRGVGYVIK